MRIINSYGNFYVYLGLNEDWNYEANYITSSPKVDPTTYRIIDDLPDQENVTPLTDEQKANLGVYGGEYSWEK